MSPQEILHLRIASRRKHMAQNSSDSQPDSLASHQIALSPSESSSLVLAGDNTLLDSEMDLLPNPLVDEYLSEQNEKFNSLIHRNLKEVMTQQQQFEEGSGWRRLAFDLLVSKNIPEATLRANQIVNKVSATAAAYFPQMKAKSSPQAFIEEYEAHMAHEHTRRLIEQFLELEREAIYKELELEFGSQKPLQLLSTERLMGPDATYVDKMEALFILSLRLSFAGLRHSIPIMKQAATKFRNDEIILFNSSNFDLLLSLIISILEKVERKVQVSVPDSPKLEKVDGYSNKYTSKNSADSTEDSKEWARSMLKLVAGPDHSVRSPLYIERQHSSRIQSEDDNQEPGTFGYILDAAQKFASEMS